MDGKQHHQLHGRTAVRFDELAGIRGLKQIYKILEAIETDDLKKDAVFSRHTAHYLNRCYPDWMK